MGEVRGSVLQVLQGRRWARCLLDVKLGRRSKPRPSPGAQGLGGLGTADGHGRSTPEERAMSRGGTGAGRGLGRGSPSSAGALSAGSATAVSGVREYYSEAPGKEQWESLSACCLRGAMDSFPAPLILEPSLTPPRPSSLSAGSLSDGLPWSRRLCSCPLLSLSNPPPRAGRWQPDVQKEAGRAFPPGGKVRAQETPGHRARYPPRSQMSAEPWVTGNCWRSK